MKWRFIASKGQPKRKFCVPGSKSHTIRAVAIASLAKGQSIIRNPLISTDAQAAVYTYRALGAKIDTTDTDLWRVRGTGGQITAPREDIYVGNSGTTLRIAMGSAALAAPGQTTTFTGDEQIQTRPLSPLMDAISDLGAKCTSLKNNGKAPVQVRGRLTGGKTTIACHTSQYLSSLLLCAPLASKDTQIDVTLLNEPGYVQMTLDWLDKQHIKYEITDSHGFATDFTDLICGNRRKENESELICVFKIKGRQSYTGFNTTIPADFSSATFFFCAAALLAQEQVTITGLDFNDSQPDKKVVDYLKRMGADIRQARRMVNITARPLKGITINMNDTPDALPAMAVTAAFAKGTTKLLNVPQARIKETDRIKGMAEELRKMGVDIEELPDGLIIRGGIRLKPANLDGRNDHRMVMALAVALLSVRYGQGTLRNVGAQAVTFPKFIDFVDSLGGTKIETVHSTLSSLGKKCATVFERITGKKRLPRNMEAN